MSGGRAIAAEHLLDEDALRRHPYLRALEAGGMRPPAAHDIDRGDLRRLEAAGLVVDCGGTWFAAAAIEAAARSLAILFDDRTDGLTVAEIRDNWETSRKLTMAVLAWMDSNGVTRRNGDLRFEGPRLHQPDVRSGTVRPAPPTRPTSERVGT